MITQNDDSGDEGDDEWDKAAHESYVGRGRGQREPAVLNASNLVQTDVLTPLQAGARAVAAAIATNHNNGPSRETMRPGDHHRTESRRGPIYPLTVHM